jgi:hypothetical protein
MQAGFEMDILGRFISRKRRRSGPIWTLSRHLNEN